MGHYFFNFNYEDSEQDCHCQCGCSNSNKIDDATNLILDYINLLSHARNQNEIGQILSSFYAEVYNHAIKEYLNDEIALKTEALRFIGE